MKNKGIVKIDEVGRLVIPKDVRELLNLNDKLVRVYVDDDRVIIKKYAPISLYKSLLSCVCNEVEKLTGCACVVGDMRIITEVSKDELKFLKGKSISNELKKIVTEERNAVINISNGYDAIRICEGIDFEYNALCLTTLRDEFSLLGFLGVIATNGAKLGERELNALNIAKQLFLTVVKSQKNG